MTEKRKICVVTGTRSEYGHLSRLMRKIREDKALELQLIATGTHLSKEHGETYHEIEADGFTIDRKIDILSGTSDSPVGVADSMAKALSGFSRDFADLKPDIIVVLGDRYEILAAVSAALVTVIPVAHISGGEITEGAFDDAIRHSITKMSHLHFTACEDYRKRVIQLGEEPDRVFNVGELSVDSIMDFTVPSKEEFEESISRELKAKNLLVTFHPVTLEKGQSAEQFRNLLDSLDKLDDILLIFTKPNADTGGMELIGMLDEYVEANPEKAVSFTSLGHKRYLAALNYVDAVVGNSSSGITEAPSFKIGTINIGSRQKGRIRAASVIDCEPSVGSIVKALKKLYSPEFQDTLKSVKSPFGDGGTAEKIKEILKTFDLSAITSKHFFDLGGVE